MIRFSHSANSWMVNCDSDGWKPITVQEARECIDCGFGIIHLERLSVHYL